MDALGHYVVGRELGHGSFGRVMRAVNKLSGESVRRVVVGHPALLFTPCFSPAPPPPPSACSCVQVAIKVISKAGISNVGFAERVSREFFILTCLSHVNVIRLYEVRTRLPRPRNPTQFVFNRWSNRMRTCTWSWSLRRGETWPPCLLHDLAVSVLPPPRLLPCVLLGARRIVLVVCAVVWPCGIATVLGVWCVCACVYEVCASVCG